MTEGKTKRRHESNDYRIDYKSIHTSSTFKIPSIRTP